MKPDIQIKDFFEVTDATNDSDGLVFAAFYPLFEDDRIVGTLRYIRNNGQLQKVDTDTANKILSARHPEWVFHSSICDAKLSGVPFSVKPRIFSARKRLSELRQKVAVRCGERDFKFRPLEQKLVQVLSLLERENIATCTMGVTGSLLVDAQTEHSDIDLVSYDRNHFQQLQDAAERLTSRHEYRLTHAMWQETHAKRGTTLSFEQFVSMETRKRNKMSFENTKIDFALIDESESSSQKASIGQRAFKKIGIREFEATIIDDKLAFDTPGRLRLDGEVAEVVIFSHTFIGHARVGEKIRVKGWLEFSPDGYQQIVVGTSRESRDEFIEVI